MTIYVYISELTRRHIITTKDHGGNWIMLNGEVFDIQCSGELDSTAILVVDNNDVQFAVKSDLI